MTSKERALTSHLISKIEKNKQFTDDIGLSYTTMPADMAASSTQQEQKKSNKSEKAKSFNRN